MDVIYTVGAGGSDELRYSLRSLANLPHDQVWIAGVLPDWVTGVRHIPVPQRGDRWANATAAWLAACREPEVSDPFVYFNDDFFVLAPVTEVPLMHRGPVDDVVKRIRTDGHRRAMTDTAAWLATHPVKTVLAYDLHTPMVVGKAKFAEVLEAAAASPRRLLPKTMYGNLHVRAKGKQVADAKVHDGGELPAPELLPAGAFVSTSDAAWKLAAGEQIRTMFPDPSPYELVPEAD